MLKTPFGNIEIYFDNQIQKNIKVVKDKKKYKQYQELSYIFLLVYSYQSDQRTHTLKCILNTNKKGVVESGEHLDAISFYINRGKITIGCRSDFGMPKEGGFDFDGDYMDNGLGIYINSSTKSQCFVFVVSWLLKCTDKNDIQTWFASDFALYNNKKNPQN